MRLRSLGLVFAIGAMVLAACGTNNPLGLTGTTTTQSAIRFINGSPDVGTVDVYLNGTGSAATATAVAYKGATALSYINSQTYTVNVTPTGSKTTSLACTTPSLAANTRYTVVIAGKVAGSAANNTQLQCQIFPETIYSLPPGSFQLAMHNASPALALIVPAGTNGAVGFGLYSPSAPPVYGVFASTTLAAFTPPSTGGGSGPVATATAVNVLPGGVLNPPGVGIYVSLPAPNPPTAGSVVSTITPDQLQAGFSAAVGSTCDPQKFYPIQTPSPTPTPTSTTPPTPAPTPTPVCTQVSTVMSVYAVDGPPAGPTAVLVGVTD